MTKNNIKRAKIETTEHSRLNSAAADIVCAILEPFIYDENIDKDRLFDYIDSKYAKLFNNPYRLLDIGHEEFGIEDIQNNIRIDLNNKLEGD